MIIILLRFWLPLAFVAVYAGVRGSAPERMGAALLVAAASLTLLVRPDQVHRYGSVERGVLLVDMVLMLALVGLAVRANRLWPSILAALHGLTLLGHLGKAENPDLWALGYHLMITLPVLPGLAVLAAGVWSHDRRMRRSGSDPSWRS